MGRWRLLTRVSCEINTDAYCDGKMDVDKQGDHVSLIPVLIVMGRWMLMARGSCEISTVAYCDGKMEVDDKGIM
jgi:hypothetical protein